MMTEMARVFLTALVIGAAGSFIVLMAWPL